MDARLHGALYLIAPVKQIENRNREYDHCDGQGGSQPFHGNHYTRRNPSVKVRLRNGRSSG